MLFCVTSWGQDPFFIKKNKEALERFVKTNPKLKKKLKEAYAYAIIARVVHKPTVGFGGSMGKGIVLVDGAVVGTCYLDQINHSVTLGGEVYSELILFEDENSYQELIAEEMVISEYLHAHNLSPETEVSEIPYKEGLIVFTKGWGELAYLPDIDNQGFKYKSVEEENREANEKYLQSIIPPPPTIESID